MEKAIAIVCYGTANRDVWMSSGGQLEEEVRRAYPEWNVEVMFTSRILTERCRRAGWTVTEVQEGMERLVRQGVRSLVVLPVYLMAGEAFGKVKAAVQSCTDCQDIRLGIPLLENPDGCRAAAEAIIKEGAPDREETLAAVLHGTRSETAGARSHMEAALQEATQQPALAAVMGEEWQLQERLMRSCAKKVLLIPLTLMVGKHAAQDIAGETPESMRCWLEQKGYAVRSVVKGLLEYSQVRQSWLRQLQRLIDRWE